ncbi:hypothetical protein NI17_023200 [Thermobifida halotolerans]|uniref:Uncharacterized protein n=1 Tax=Thermobifida halotolerans TaxID=483545 RepID=A0A399FZD1_9ACTN|nr:hypothetical protein [Thermobifida halotolerans]UOE19573.1 hypothetical protein NI17_023200 [Thermobifida halotolerans]
MPRKRRRISAFVKILVVLTLACGLLVAAGIYVMRSIKPLDLSPPPPEDGCRLATEEDTDTLEVEQAANAATVAGVAFSRDLPAHAVVVSYATVWQESKFYNIEYGDRDSLGLFQQRPSMEWGSPEEIIDPVYASSRFYEELVTVEGYLDLPVYEAAQAVQRSADGFAYDQHEARSRSMAQAFTGAAGAAVTCWFPEEEAGTTDVAAAVGELRRVFGVGPEELGTAQRQTGDLGWAMAQWAVAHASSYGLTSVTYLDRRWTAESGEEGWQTTQTVSEELVLR